MTWRPGKLKHLSSLPISNGLGEAAIDGKPVWPRYVRTTDIAGPRALRDDIRASLPPTVASGAMLRRGDIVFTAAGTIGKSLLYPDDAAACYAGYLVRFRPRPDVDGRFISYWAQSQPFWDQLETGKVVSTIENFSASKYQNLELLVPPHIEQRAIADFLDAETARIDALIAKKNKVASALTERRLALARAAMEGTWVGESTRQASVPWLASIPESWDRVSVSMVYDVQLGLMLNEQRAKGEHLRPYMRNANVGWGRLELSDVAEMNFPPGVRQRYRLRVGDLLVCEGGAGVAESAVWRGEIDECYYQKSLHRVRAIAGYPVEWLAEWLRLWKYVGAHEAEGNLATIPHLTAEQLKSHAVPLPAPSVCRQILERVHREDRIIADCQRSLSQQIELLEERRRALVTAAVTGQMAVPGVGGA